MVYPGKPHIKKVTTAWGDADWHPEQKKELAGWLNVHVECKVTSQSRSVRILAGDWDRWANLGEFAQTVFTYLTPSDRELLISGTSDEGWDKVFSGDK